MMPFNGLSPLICFRWWPRSKHLKPNEFDEITNIINGREIVVIEDNCESMGATYNGKQAGTFGVMGSYSSFFSHHISTMEGGVVVTDDEELYHVMLSLRAYGWTRNHPKFLIQREIGNSSRFGFSLVLCPDAGFNRAGSVKQLQSSGFECRPIVAGNFTKNEVMKYFDASIHGTLKNADHIDQNGFFIGNHHYLIEAAIAALTQM